MKIRPVTRSDRAWVTRTVADHFASARIVSRGVLHDSNELSGFVALQGTSPCGLLLYAVCDDQSEVVVLISLVRRTGVAGELLGAVERAARDAGCRRLWLVTTNDNQTAIDFYRHRGWCLKKVHEGAVAEARRLKAEIPDLGRNGIPIRDELEFELFLSNGGA